jgi:hypothetical protein
MVESKEINCFKLEHLDPNDARCVQVVEELAELYHKSVLPLYLEGKGVLIVSSISGIFGENVPHSPFPNEIRLFFEDVNGNAKGAIYCLTHKPVDIEKEPKKSQIIQLHDPNC